MGAVMLWRLRRQPQHIFSVIFDAFFIGSSTILMTVLLDSMYYGTVTFTPLNFVRTNLSSVSLFYGSSPWHYYLSQAIPILCTTTLPFVLRGAWLATYSPSSALKIMLGLLAWTIGVYSLAGHKEWRFLHPLLPVMNVFAAKALVDADMHTGDPHTAAPLAQRYSRPLILLGLPAIIYVSLFHGRAQIDVMHYLRNLPPGEVHSIGFLMPCHSTPWQAYLHRADLADAGRLWALGCEPPLSGQNVDLYKDQTDAFYKSPVTYLETHFPSDVNTTFPPSPLPCTMPGTIVSEGAVWQHEWPEYIVLFGALLDEPVRDVLEQKRYREVWKSESGWESDRRRQGGVRVWKFQFGPGPILDP